MIKQILTFGWESKFFLFQSLHSEGGQLRVTMANGNVMTIPLTDDQDDPNGINITEELTRSGVWKSLPGNDATVTSFSEIKVPKNDDAPEENDENGIELTFTKKPYEDA